MFPEDAEKTVVAAQEIVEFENKDDVPKMRLPTYDDMGFPDYGLDRI